MANSCLAICAARDKGKMMFKKGFRETALRFGPSRRIYESARSGYHRWRKLFFYVHDARQSMRFMRWKQGDKSTYWAASAELLFYFHKLEKGLCMPGEKRFFGYEPASMVVRLLSQWRSNGFSVTDPIYLGAIETIRAYRRRVDETPHERSEHLRHKLDEALAGADVQSKYSTPNPVHLTQEPNLFVAFSHLSDMRRSVRDFRSGPVPAEVLANAVSVAKLSPSACNRQPCRVHAFADREEIDALLMFQNGNRGFGHTAPLLLVLTAEANGFFDASERYQPYVDGGLFAMSLIYALQAQGLSSCCLNWCVEPATDYQAHIRANIRESEIIVMYIAVGYAQPNAVVPRSPRRSNANVLVNH